MAKRVTTEDFIARAITVHGDRYDYSLAKYEKTHSKVKIVCPEHGVWLQTPANHLSGFGCRLCGLKNAGQYHKKDSNSFIEEAKSIHGDQYDYSKVDYRGAREKVTIVCRQHGPFEQVASTHLRPAHCPVCSYQDRNRDSRLSWDEFCSRARELHGGKYRYSDINYVDTSSRITISCPEHGVFLQTPAGHLAGRGCAKCGPGKAGDQMRKSTEAFLVEARKVHGDKYDYSKVNYLGAREPIIVICPFDGEFIQQAGSHLANPGCPKCSRRSQGAPRNLVRALRGEFDTEKLSFVYLIEFKLPNSGSTLYKVGSGSGTRINTTKNSIRKIGGRDIEVWSKAFDTSGEAIVFEHLTQEQIQDYQFVVLPEFKFPGYSEVFSRKPDISLVNRHPVLIKFMSGDRWNLRE